MNVNFFYFYLNDSIHFWMSGRRNFKLHTHVSSCAIMLNSKNDLLASMKKKKGVVTFN